MVNPVRLKGARRRLVPVLLLATGLLVGACAGAPADSAEDGADGIRDPLEPMNRLIFSMNLAADTVVIRPAADLYRTIIPRPGRDAVRSFLRNLESPVILANDILQGELSRAGITTVRFLINSTAGIAGLFDVAAKMGYERHSEDFGQTLGRYGMDEGFFLMLPILGPSSFRDALGLGVDFYFDPLNYWADNTGHEELMVARTVVRGIDARSRTIETLDEIERTSIDFYATVRSLYRQQRNDEIRNGEMPSLPPLPDYTRFSGPDDSESVAAGD